MGYTPGDIAPRDGVVYCLTPNETAHVNKGERFPPTREKNCQWEYLNFRDSALHANWGRIQREPVPMTVRELKEKLSKHDDQTRTVVSWEEQNRQRLFEIDAVSLARGNPFRDANGKAGFAFDQNGREKWLFIEVDPA